jgi:thiol:disulfide interchange protein DsbD
MHQRLAITIGLCLSLFLAMAPQQAGAEEELLLPEQAFRLSGQADGETNIAITWQIADGYYLYKNKIRFHGNTEGIELGEPQFPQALTKHDEFFGKVEIYRETLQISIPITRAADSSDLLNLEAASQGCADQGLCYPPQRQTLLLKLPAATTATATATASDASASTPLAALAKLGQNLGLQEDDEILDPEDAFRFDAMVESANRLRLFWAIAEGTFLYKEKIEISLENAEGVSLGAFELPPAKLKQDTVKADGSIGDVEIYLHEIDLPLPLLRSATTPTRVTLTAKFQGCAERGICYPPMSKTIALDLPAANPEDLASAATLPAPTPQTIASDDNVSEQDQIADTLRQGNIWLIIVTFFGFGLLLALTPCVFPMIPILSGIIAGQGSAVTPRKAFVLSLVYVLAMAFTYTIAGVLAGLFGENLQAAFQDPWILGIFSLIFVGLALSMFGFYELQLPSSLQSKLAQLSNRQTGGTLMGAAVMGLLSALIVGPCVAPPLAGALIYIGQTGDALLGGLALFALSMGMGAPLIAIGTSAGKLLPRAGAWMDAVKAVFGVLLLAVALIMLERILPAEIALLLWGALMICSSVYMGALRDLPIEASGWERLWKGLGLVLLVYGALMLVGAAAGGKDTLQPLRGLVATGGAAGTPQSLHFKRIKTLQDLQQEVAAATARNQPVMLDFYADWCVSCKEMERYTFSNPQVIQLLQDVVLLQADVTANDAQDHALLQEHFGLPGPPAIMFYGRDGSERRHYRLVGFKPAEEFAAHIRKAIQ